MRLHIRCRFLEDFYEKIFFYPSKQIGLIINCNVNCKKYYLWEYHFSIVIRAVLAAGLKPQPYGGGLLPPPSSIQAKRLDQGPAVRGGLLPPPWVTFTIVGNGLVPFRPHSQCSHSNCVLQDWRHIKYQSIKAWGPFNLGLPKNWVFAVNNPFPLNCILPARLWNLHNLIAWSRQRRGAP